MEFMGHEREEGSAAEFLGHEREEGSAAEFLGHKREESGVAGFVEHKSNERSTTEFLGHKSEDGREQSLLEHLEGTAKLCEAFTSKFDIPGRGLTLGMYHDIGKYSAGFQNRIKNNGPRVDHATAGAQVVGKFPMASFCIAGHHGGLPDRGSKADPSSFMSRMNKKLEGKLEYQAFKNEVKFTPVMASPTIDANVNKNFAVMLYTRMLFSSLVDADFLDTEAFMEPNKPKRGDFKAIANLDKDLEQFLQKFSNPDTEIKKKRNEILAACLQMADSEPGLFSLTVPTGGGKTIASLAFALKHALKYNKDRIIYVIPYTSIIEQTADVFREIFGAENVLEHHMQVNYDGEEGGKDTDEAKERLREKFKLATENWDAPIIVTTNVQFFESLFAAKVSKCRKLHNIVNSVVIFDEAQMLPNEYLLPCTKAIEELVLNYSVSAVLCTATQPNLTDFFCDKVACREMMSNVQELYNFFKRVNYHMLPHDSCGDIEQLLEKLNQHEQVLCVVNSKKDAQEIFAGLEGEGNFHLSTFMAPIHRREILAKIRLRLAKNLPCKVVATSLIEAGVDVDFPVVYREIAGLDSIVQAAGRCNREGRRKLENSTVYIYDFNKKLNQLPHFVQQPITLTRDLAKKFTDIASVTAISDYFADLHYIKGQDLDRKKIYSEKSAAFAFATIAEEFKLIEENTRSVIIPSDERSEELVRLLQMNIRSRGMLRELGMYSVNVFPSQYQKLLEGGKLDLIDDYISVLRDMSAYDEEKGLVLECESGVGLFF